MHWLIHLSGVGIIFVVLTDIYLTVFYPRTRKTMISLQVSRGIWEIFRRLSRLPFSKGKKVLSYCGPTVLISIVLLWVCSLVVGFGLLVWPALGTGIQASEGSTPTDFSTALYYSGYTLTTLGVGDLVPKNDFWRLITVVEAAAGFSVITVTITYLFSVYGALTQRNIFALSLHHRSAEAANAAVLLVQLQGYGQFDPAFQQIPQMASNLLFLLESHHSYPVLHYFRFQSPHYALSRIALISLDLATLIKTALHPQEYQPLIESAAVTELVSGGQALLAQLETSFLGQYDADHVSSLKEWRHWYFQAIDTLQKNGVKTVGDLEAGADHYVALRCRWNSVVVGLTQYMDYTWTEIAPAETAE